MYITTRIHTDLFQMLLMGFRDHLPVPLCSTINTMKLHVFVEGYDKIMVIVFLNVCNTLFFVIADSVDEIPKIVLILCWDSADSDTMVSFFCYDKCC